MQAERTEQAVIDRIVEGHAVLLVGDEEIEATVPAVDLPEGADEGSVVTVESDGVTWRVVDVNHEETQRRRSALAARLTGLKSRRSRGRFNRGG